MNGFGSEMAKARTRGSLDFIPSAISSHGGGVVVGRLNRLVIIWLMFVISLASVQMVGTGRRQAWMQGVY